MTPHPDIRQDTNGQTDSLKAAVLSVRSSVSANVRSMSVQCPFVSGMYGQAAPSLKTQFEDVAAWWSWSESDRTAWAAYAREHLEEATEFIRLAYQEIQAYIRLGLPSVEHMVSTPAPVTKGHAHETR